MEKVRVGIVGLGFMGTTHFRIYDELENAQVVAIADIDPDKRSGDISKVVGNIGGAKNESLDLSEIATYDNYQDLVQNAEIDMVDICVPTPDHFAIATAALNAGKHVFCEKPVCRNLSELHELQSITRRTDGFFNVGMCIRAWPEYDHLRSLYQSGALGGVERAFFRRLSPELSGNAWDNWFMDGTRSGGALLDLHLHDTDFICYMFGRPTAVTSFGLDDCRSENGTDYVLTNYHFKDAVIAAEGGWSSNRNTPFEMSFHAVFEKATVLFNSSGYNIYWEDGRSESPDVANPQLPTGWHVELDYFVRCILEDVVPCRYQDMESIADSFQVVMAEQKSVSSGKQITIEYKED